MTDFAEWEKLAKEAGFTAAAPLEAASVRLYPEVRAACEKNSCGLYGRRWSGPPGCGALEDCRTRIAAYQRGILVQTTGELEDAFDGEGMMRVEALHKEQFCALHERLLLQYPRLLALGTGGCTRCRDCTYPKAPCRFPQKMTASMEAYGLLVHEICQNSGLRYYY